MTQTEALKLMLRMQLAAHELLYVVEVKETKMRETTLRVSALRVEVDLGALDAQRGQLDVLSKTLLARILENRGRLLRKEAKPSAPPTLSDKEERDRRKMLRAIARLKAEKKRLENAPNKSSSSLRIERARGFNE